MHDDAVIRSPLTDRIDGRDVVHKVPFSQVDGDLAIGGALFEDSAERDRESAIRLVVAQLLPHTHWSPAHLVPDFLFPSSPVLLSMVRRAATRTTRREWNEMVLEEA